MENCNWCDEKLDFGGIVWVSIDYPKADLYCSEVCRRYGEGMDPPVRLREKRYIYAE